MGLFGGSRKVSVSSTSYNLAGDQDLRPDFLKTTVLGGVLSGSDSLARTISDSYLSGPGLRFRGFGRWARTRGYNETLEWEGGSLSNAYSLDKMVVSEYLQQTYAPVGTKIQLQSAVIDYGDFGYWADRYVLENYPERFDTQYAADFVDETGDITLTWEDDTSTTFTPSGFDTNARYLYASYYVITPGESQPIVPGNWVSLAPSEAFPVDSSWQKNTLSETPVAVSLDRTVVTTVSYSDDTPDETTTDTHSRAGSYTKIQGEYEKTVFQGDYADQDVTYSVRSIVSVSQTGQVTSDTSSKSSETTDENGVTKVTTVVTTRKSVSLTRRYKLDTQNLLGETWGPLSLVIYGENGGSSTLNAMFKAETPVGDFLPMMPFIVKGRFVYNRSVDYVSMTGHVTPGDPVFAEYYRLSKKAFKKAMNTKYTTVERTLRDNDNVKDNVDYAYAVFGVSLNTKENSARKYLYSFFQHLFYNYTMADQAQYLSWRDQYQSYLTTYAAYKRWVEGQKDPSSSLYGAVRPSITAFPHPSQNKLVVRTREGSPLNYRVILVWNFIMEDSGTGMLSSDHRAGDVWIEKGVAVNYDEELYYRNPDGTRKVITGSKVKGDPITINWQETANSWRRLTITGLGHINKVYDGHAVETWAYDALDDDEESSLIVPLHETTFKEMSLKDSTQMCTACAYMVLNSYQVTRTKWYQSGAFKVVLIVAAIVVTVYTGGAGAGVLGTAASVGASLGFVGVAAIVAGSIANALAAMVLAQILQQGATALFGDKIGVIVAAIATVVAVRAGTAYSTGQSMATAYGSMMNANNIMQLTSAVGKGYTGYMQASAQQMANQTKELNQEYEDQVEQLQQLWDKNLSNNNGAIDTTVLTDALYNTDSESADQFISRTLLTGSDIADMSLKMIGNFSTVTLNTSIS